MNWRLTNGESEFGNPRVAGGSMSVRTSYTDLRKVGAAAKEVFIKAAAAKWNVNVTNCYAENGKVFHQPTKKSFTYGELVEDAAKLELPKEPKLKDPKDFKILGKQRHRPDVPMKINPHCSI
ncbi:MAG TPA: hypothetical protein VFW07_03420 [Parafilimonas sp.]|nr:hypothetical protein [Parafilimonas sp.]